MAIWVELWSLWTLLIALARGVAAAASCDAAQLSLCPAATAKLAAAAARRLPLAVSMVWAECPPDPDAVDPLAPPPRGRGRDRRGDRPEARDPAWCLGARRRLLHGGFDQLASDRARLRAALGQACVLRRRTNGTVPLVVLARGLSASARRALCDAGALVLDAPRLFGSNPRDAWAPLDAAAARAARRTVTGHVQSRTDGPLTYFKFATWRLGCFFDRVLHVDLDATVLADPRPFARDHAAATGIVAEEEDAGRGFVGTRTHIVLLVPDDRVFGDLVVARRLFSGSSPSRARARGTDGRRSARRRAATTSS